MPVKLVVAEDPELSLSTSGFALHQLWRARPTLTAQPMLVGTGENRLFPSVAISALVLRKPGFVVFNVALPVVSFPLLSLCQCFLPVAEAETRLGITLTLVLTVVAYKSEIGRMTPDVRVAVSPARLPRGGPEP